MLKTFACFMLLFPLTQQSHLNVTVLYRIYCVGLTIGTSSFANTSSLTSMCKPATSIGRPFEFTGFAAVDGPAAGKHNT